MLVIIGSCIFATIRKQPILFPSKYWPIRIQHLDVSGCRVCSWNELESLSCPSIPYLSCFCIYFWWYFVLFIMFFSLSRLCLYFRIIYLKKRNKNNETKISVVVVFVGVVVFECLISYLEIIPTKMPATLIKFNAKQLNLQRGVL